MANIGVHIHVHDDAFTCERGNADVSKPYYVLKVGEAALFIDAPRIADLISALQSVAPMAAADCQLKAEAA